jgi:isopentenyl-diphosphate delta-isomerase
MEKVILVNEKDKEIGTEEKIKAHKEGKLHRCFSIFIFNSKGKLLIQQRAKSKYHSPLLWSNTCCSHPRPNEKLIKAAKRRLKEEMGIETNLKEIFSFIYQAKSGKWIEHEFDHVFVGKFDGNPKPNKNEVEDFKWVKLRELKREMKKHPRKYTFWFKRILKLYAKKFKNLF